MKPAEVIQRAATRMNRLIQDLLDVALMEAGQLTIERARLSAGDLIVEAVDMQRPLASSSSLELRVDVDRDASRQSGVIGTGSFRCSRTSSAMRSSSRSAGGRITVGAAPRDHEVVFWVGGYGLWHRAREPAP